MTPGARSSSPLQQHADERVRWGLGTIQLLFGIERLVIPVDSWVSSVRRLRSRELPQHRLANELEGVRLEATGGSLDLPVALGLCRSGSSRQHGLIVTDKRARPIADQGPAEQKVEPEHAPMVRLATEGGDHPWEP